MTSLVTLDMLLAGQPIRPETAKRLRRRDGTRGPDEGVRTEPGGIEGSILLGGSARAHRSGYSIAGRRAWRLRRYQP